VSYLYYADRVYQLPLGVVGIAIGIVLLPDLTRRLKAEDGQGAQASQNRAFEFSMLLTVPAAMALMVIPTPIIQILFERGAFESGDTRATALALGAFSLGLPAFVLTKVLAPGFFAREDTKTPMIFTAIGIAVNITAALALFPLIGYVGVALATSLAAWVTAGLLGVRLYRDGHFIPDARLKSRLPRILLASALMGGALWAGAAVLAPWLTDIFFWQVTALSLLVAGGAVIFALACLGAGAAHWGELRAIFRRQA